MGRILGVIRTLGATKGTVVVLSLVVLVCVAVTPVLAHDSNKHWHNGHGADPDNCKPGPDCVEITYNRDELDSIYQTAWGSAYLAWHGSDILDWTWSAGHYDQEILSRDLGQNGAYGAHRPIWVSGQPDHFAHSLIEMNDHYLGEGGPRGTTAWRTNTMCHEMGHSFGLNHFTNSNIATSCMNSHNLPNPTTAGSHDISDIRGIYD